MIVFPLALAALSGALVMFCFLKLGWASVALLLLCAAALSAWLQV